MTTVETKVQEAVLTAIGNLLIPRVELALKSVNVSTGHVVGSVVLDLDQRDFSEKVEGLQITASSRINANTDLNEIDETRSNNTIEAGELLVNEMNVDRHEHSHLTQLNYLSYLR